MNIAIAEEAVAYADAAVTAEMSLLGLLFQLAPLIILLFVGVVITLAIVLPITLSAKKRRAAELAAQQLQTAAPIEVQAMQAEGRVITKRVHAGRMYFIGFEFADGSRMELSVDGTLYGVLLEGDEGLVTWYDGQLLEFSRRIGN